MERGLASSFLGKGDTKDAVVVSGGDFLGVDGFGERKCTLEVAVGAFDAMVAAFLLFRSELPGSADGQGTVFQLDVDILHLDARDIRGEDEFVFVLNDIDGRGPGADTGRLIEHAVHDILEDPDGGGEVLEAGEGTTNHERHS
ncbi:MAG: hypothetical protein M9913_07730 [Bryobacteraceae bacterium]|nr:hypothetical protein [Bryobacteraceae bacterium]